MAGAPSETVEVRETIWGPVTERWGRAQAIRWIAHDPEGHRTAYLDLAVASNIEDAFRAGWGSGMPPQNVVAVDREGSIGWTIAGPVPRRRGFDGRLPESWADGTRNWDGYLEPGEIPAIRNPDSGLLWTANNRLVDGVFLDRIGRGGSYVHGERARLIRDRLFAVEAADEAAMLDIQLEDHAGELAVWRGLFLDALEGASDPWRRRLAAFSTKDGPGGRVWTAPPTRWCGTRASISSAGCTARSPRRRPACCPISPRASPFTGPARCCDWRRKRRRTSSLRARRTGTTRSDRRCSRRQSGCAPAGRWPSRPGAR